MSASFQPPIDTTTSYLSAPADSRRINKTPSPDHCGGKKSKRGVEDRPDEVTMVEALELQRVRVPSLTTCHVPSAGKRTGSRTWRLPHPPLPPPPPLQPPMPPRPSVPWTCFLGLTPWLLRSPPTSPPAAGCGWRSERRGRHVGVKSAQRTGFGMGQKNARLLLNFRGARAAPRYGLQSCWKGTGRALAKRRCEAHLPPE